MPHGAFFYYGITVRLALKTNGWESSLSPLSLKTWKIIKTVLYQLSMVRMLIKEELISGVSWTRLELDGMVHGALGEISTLSDLQKKN